MSSNYYKIENLDTKEVFLSFSDAAKAYNLHALSFSHKVRQHRAKHAAPWTFTLGKNKWRVTIRTGEKVQRVIGRIPFQRLAKTICKVYDTQEGTPRERIRQTSFLVNYSPFAVALCIKNHGYKEVTEDMKEGMFPTVERQKEGAA